jgi:hypothetical protein
VGTEYIAIALLHEDARMVCANPIDKASTRDHGLMATDVRIGRGSTPLIATQIHTHDTRRKNRPLDSHGT